MHEQELLVILNDAQADDVLEYIDKQYSVKQKISPRVFIIGRPAQIETLRTIPAVMTIADKEVPPDVFETLDTNEALFVRAWSERLKTEDKTRPGEGLSWDAEGYEPPDPPPARPSS